MTSNAREPKADFQANDDGLHVGKAREVPRWRESEVFTPLERDVMDYAEAMSQTPPTVTDELSARLSNKWGRRQSWSSPCALTRGGPRRPLQAPE